MRCNRKPKMVDVQTALPSQQAGTANQGRGDYFALTVSWFWLKQANGENCALSYLRIPYSEFIWCA